MRRAVLPCLQMRTIFKYSWSTVSLWPPAGSSSGAAHEEILLLLFPIAASFVLVQKLLMFLPEDFRLLLKPVGPGWQQRGHVGSRFTAPGKWACGGSHLALCLDSLYISVMTRSFSSMKLLWTSSNFLKRQKHFPSNHFTQTWFLCMVKKKKERVTWRRRCGLRCWAA